MALTSGVTKALPIPHEPGVQIVIRMLGWVHLKEARDRKSAAALQSARELGPELLRDIQAVRPEIPSSITTAFRDPLDDYDQGVVLRYGITSWSYPEPCNDENKADLDPTTAEWAAREICALSLGVRDDAERLGRSVPSTST